jgi:hypothetical protein
MKQLIKFAGFFLITMVVFASCKKEKQDTIVVTPTSPGNNKPPVANAGLDQVITLPISAVTINGNNSSDPDGSITSYSWSQVMGPNQSVIINPMQVSSLVNNLVAGTYQFKLKVTDNGGLSAKDTVQILINPEIISCAVNRAVINAQLVPFGKLSQPRIEMVTVTAGTKILFAGGILPGGGVSTRVDIYDFVTNKFSTAELSVGRQGMTASSVGDKIFFAGGHFNYSRVDIYNTLTDTWTTAELSEARASVATATIGDKVFFAGGSIWGWYDEEAVSNRVDIYNNTTNTWSTASLSEGRNGISATSTGNKIYFAGGYKFPNYISKIIDIYDGATNSWSTSEMNEGKTDFASFAVANKIYWAGGINSFSAPYARSNKVEIKDINTQASTFACLSQSKSEFHAILKGNEIVFFTPAWSGSDIFDIYNTVTDTWSVGKLNQVVSSAAIISVNNKIYVAGGEVGGGGFSNKVWLLEW